ncbi:MAG: class I SAM-dependent methyltransferase [Vicinamibacterales bacterium]
MARRFPPSFEARDPFAAGLFPVCVSTHDAGTRLLFDLATCILLLNCRPGDRVLDVGAGSGFSSEMLARFGYDVVAMDPDHQAMRNNLARTAHDRERVAGTVAVTQAVAESLPFANGSFDAVLAMNVLHHVPDLPGAVREFARVLRPEGRLVCSEPGTRHLEERQTQRAIRELGEGDEAFDVLQFLPLARRSGFSFAAFPATLHPDLVLVPDDEVGPFRRGVHPDARLTPGGLVDHVQRDHPFAVLVREGQRVPTSRRPGRLGRALEVRDLPASARAGQVVPALTAVNTGDTIWLATPGPLGGYVTAGVKVLAESGRLVTDRPGRTMLDGDVAPGERVDIALEIDLPPALPAGRYTLQFDLVNELVCWFGDLPPNEPVMRTIDVQ